MTRLIAGYAATGRTRDNYRSMLVRTNTITLVDGSACLETAVCEISYSRAIPLGTCFGSIRNLPVNVVLTPVGVQGLHT